MTETPEPLAFPLATSSWDERELTALQRVIDGGRFTMGPRVAEFERAIAETVGSRYAVMVNSGSSANLLAVAAAVLDPGTPLQAGDEVLVPAVSWATTYYPLQQYGLRPRFVDIDIDTLNMDLDLAEAAIGPRTKGVFAVNLLGNPIDYGRLTPLAADNGLVLLEDNCESLGARFGGQATGTFGLMGTLSSFFSHHISTMEGGVVLTDSEHLAQMLVSLRAHGWTRELPTDNSVHPKTGDFFDDLFRFVLPGYNVRPLEMSGALGVEQIAKLPHLIGRRRDNAVLFVESIGNLPDVRIQREVGESSWFGFSMVLEERLAGRRSEVVAALAGAGIESRPIVAGNFARSPVMKYLDALVPDELPAADKVHVDGLFVGNHHYPLGPALDLLRSVLVDVARR